MEDLKSLVALIDEFKKLPSVGTKSAERMAYSVLSWDEEDIKHFADALIDVKKNIDEIEKNRMKSCDFRLSDCCTYW